jgi:glycosyltransferase involved in cell wall biosynthesis
MRIAFFNWRDIRNPLAGGAEVYVHQVMKHLVAMGHSATLFTSSFPGSPRQESIDGILHVRYGGRFLMYPNSFTCYREHVAGRHEAIVESVNGMPFFTPLFAHEKVVSLIHQLTRENWYSGLPLPLAFAGYHLENHLLGPYKGRPAIAVSDSTKSELEAMGFHDVRVVHGASDISPPQNAGKERRPTLIQLGRLVKSKRAEDSLLAFSSILRTVPSAQLWIVGSGPEEASLRELAARLGISRSITFFGRVDEEKKAYLLARAHIGLFPAVREGWGLTVNEANACSTPVIGYDVPGLRDSIRPGVNGYLVPSGDHDAMAKVASGLLNDPERLPALSSSAERFSKRFSWGKSAAMMADILERCVEG